MIHDVTRSSMKKYFVVLRALRESNPRRHSANTRRSDGLANGVDIPVDRTRPHPLHRQPARAARLRAVRCMRPAARPLAEQRLLLARAARLPLPGPLAERL